MPNQYGAKAIYEKCLGKDCTFIMRRMPHDISKGTKKYCGKGCSDGKRRHVKYTPEVYTLIMDFHTAHSPDDFAAHLGSTVGAIRKLMSTMRRAGYDIPKEKGSHPIYKIGDTKIRNDRGKQYAKILTEEGWRSAVPPKEKVIITRVTRKPAGNKITSAISRPAIVKEKPVEVRKHKPTIPVCINSKTTVFVYTVEEIAGVRMKYQHLNNSIYAR